MRKFFPFLLLIPLLFVSVPNAHDWGDDFAQYMIQAKNITEGKAQTENRLVFDAVAGPFAVQAYPVGFPLMLAPLIAAYGLQIKPLLFMETLSLLVLAGLSFFYFRHYFSLVLSAFMVLLFVYNPFTLDLKSQVLAEIPFTLVLFGILHILKNQKTSRRNLVMTGLLLGLLVSIRITGLLLVPAFLLQLFFQKGKTEKESGASLSFKNLLSIIVPALCIFILLNSILLPVPLKHFFGFYSAAVAVHGVNPLENLDYYIGQISQLFIFPIPALSVWKYLVLLLLIIGWISSIQKEKSFSHWFALLYLATLLFYPYTSGGFRFLFPVFPFLIVYFFNGLKKISDRIHLKKETYLMLPVALLLMFFPASLFVVNFTGPPAEISGPQSGPSKELFTYIHEFTPADAVLVFPKARAMALYGERSVTYRLEHLTAAENDALFEKLNVAYLVLPVNPRKYNLNDPALNTYFSVNRDRYALAWRNDAFEVYQRH